MEKKEIIFWGVFLAYWVLPLLYKKIIKKQKPAETKGFTLRVLEFITAFKETSENERNQIGPEMNAPVQVEPKPTPLKVIKEEFIAPTAVRPSAREQHLQSTSTPLGKRHPEKLTVLPKSPVTVQIEKGARRKFSKQKLRNAIIWSEILGTPVGLRDN